MATNDKKLKKPSIKKSAPVSSDVNQAPVDEKTRFAWNIDSLFWGLLLITVGALLLLGNLGVVTIDWFNLWRLWPLAIIFAGLSMVSGRNWVWRIVSIVFVVASLAIVVLLGTGTFSPSGSGDSNRQQQTVQREDNAKRASIELEAGASKLTIGSRDTATVVDAVLEGNNLELQKDSKLVDGDQEISISADSMNAGWFMHGRSDWDVTLTEQLPLDLTIDAGASAIDADLSKVRLQNLTLDSGASSVELKLGNKENQQNISVNAGASTISILVPKNVDVRLVIDGGLNSKDLADLKEISEGTYQSDGFDSAEKKITITADVGLASFTIKRF